MGAICYDSPASPTVRFKKGNRPVGWGFAWYPRDGVGASVLKDPHVEYDLTVANAVQRWDRFRSSIFVCHSGTHRGRSFTDTHPFVRSHADALHHLRRLPPPSSTTLESDLLELDVSSSVDENRTFAIVATRPLSDEDWAQFVPGEMRVVSRGQLMDVEVANPAPAPQSLAPNRSSWARAQPTAPQLRVSRPELTEAVMPMPAVPRSIHGDAKTRTYDIVHETVYRYETPVETSSHTVRLQPVRDFTQDVDEYKLEISPPGQGYSYEDVFGNHVLSFQINEPYSELWVRAQTRVTTYHVEAHSALRSDKIPLIWMPWQRQMMTPFLLPPELPETELRELSVFAMSFAARREHDLLETLIDLNDALHRDFKYIPGATTLETSAFDVYTQRQGVCQDFANLFICLARLLGVPARYRIGYIHTGAEYTNQIQSEASHAWAEVYLPSVGWRGFDPTNGCIVDLDHIRVAAGRNYRDATPTQGTLYSGGGGETLEVSVKVSRVEK